MYMANLCDVERAVGSLVWLSLGIRPLLSVLGASFHAIEDARGHKRHTVSFFPGVRRELHILSHLDPISQVNLDRPTCKPTSHGTLPSAPMHPR